ncbi:MAG: FG-GAP-like repeat-containing protein [Candidatus Limnocylindrales bacterium]
MAGACAVAFALLAMFVPPTDSAQAASTCTGWQSTITPPSTIRVLRTGTGQSVTVEFRRYVRTVMASEWGPDHPVAALSAGAVAIKQYGWYYAMHWRGGRDAVGRCYDVVDTTADQVYNPARPIAPIYGAVVDATWRWSLRKGSQFFLTGYRAGNGTCGSQQDGWHLMQMNASRCAARQGESAETILRRYYGADVSLVIPGFNDITGDGVGDAAAIITDPSSGVVVASLLTTDPRMPPPAITSATASLSPVVAPAGPAPSAGLDASATAPTAPPAGTTAPPASTTASANDQAGTPLAVLGDSILVGRATTDVNGDGRLDLVQLLRAPDGTLTVQVMRSTGSGFAQAVTWWSSESPAVPPAATVPPVDPASPAIPAASAAIGPAPSTTTLVTGDFNGDGRGDVGIVETFAASAPGSTPVVAPSTRLLVLMSTGTRLETPIAWWEAAVDLGGSRFLAGDVTGDGRADLIVLHQRAGEPITTAYVARSTNRSGLLPLRTFGTVTAPIDALIPLVGDVDRSGRDDLVLGVRTGTDQLAIDVLLATPDATFVTETWWTSATPFSWTGTKLAAADLNGDGRADIVAYVDAATPGTGTIIDRFLSTGSAFAVSPWTTIPTLDWGALQAY